MLIMHVICLPLSHKNLFTEKVKMLKKQTDPEITIQTSLMILSSVNKWQYADNALHCFLLSHDNCGFYGNGNSRNVAPVGDLLGGQHLCLVHFFLF